MKKTLAIILAILMIVSAAPMTLAMHYDEPVYTSGNYTYFFDEEGRAIICGYSGTEKDIVVPAQLDGYDIYGIDHYVFQNNQYIETAVVSDGIEIIGGDVFDNCPLLKSVVIPDSVTELSADCNFGTISNCPELETVTLGKNLYAFYGYELAECPKLKEVIIDEENPYIICEDLVVYTKNRKTLVNFLDYNAESFTVHDSVRVIGSDSFSGSDIKSIRFNDELIYISYFAFCNCDSLTEIVMPNGVQTAGICIFRMSDALTNVTLSEAFSDISSGMLDNCFELKNIYIPAGLESVDQEAFYDWTYKYYGTKVPEFNFSYGGDEAQWEALAVDTLDTAPNVSFNHTHSYDCTDTYSVCDECGLTYSNSHAWKQTEIVYPENGEDGYIDFVCLTDPSHTRREILSADEIGAEGFYTAWKEAVKIYTEVDWIDSIKEELLNEFERVQLDTLEYIYGERYSVLEIHVEEINEVYGEAIESGLYTKPDYAEFDGIVECIEKAIAEGKLDPENQAVLDEMKAAVDEIRADGENTAFEYQSFVDEFTVQLQEIKAEIPVEPEIPEEPVEPDAPSDGKCPDCGGAVHENTGVPMYICVLITLIKLVVSLFNAIR